MTAAPVTETMNAGVAEPLPSVDRSHILALDGLRGVAILLVLATHFVSNLGLSATGPVWLLLAAGHAGWTGVDLFFVLSGFLITGILLDAKGSIGYYQTFYARRALRILPAYYGFLILIFLVLPAVGLGAGDNYVLARQHQSWYWLHLTNVMMAIDQIGGLHRYPSTLFWSLAVEEQFYFVWPAVLAAVSAPRLRTLCFAGILGCVALRVVGTLAGIPGLALSVLPFTRGDTLFVGALLAVEHRRGGLQRYVGRARGAAVAGAALVLFSTVIYKGLDYTDPGTAMFGSIGVTLLCGSALVFAIASSHSRFVTAMQSAGLRFFGRYSYAIYIVHTAVLAAMNHYFPFAALPTGGGFALPMQTVWAILYVTLSTVAALLSWHLVEKHFLRLKRFFRYGHQMKLRPPLTASG